jgi:Tol biopolymer transport system component
MKISTPIIFIICLLLTACAAGSAPPTPTIVRLDRAALDATATSVAANPTPTRTPIPFPSATPTATPFSVATVAGPAPTVAVASSETVTGAAKVEVVTGAVYLRAGPGLVYETIGGAQQGDQLAVTGLSASGAWFQILTPSGETGWISAQADYTRLIVTGSGDLPVIETVSPNPANPATNGTAGQPAAVRSGSNVGGRLVFATRSGGDLFVSNADGSGLRRLTGGVIDPVVSPDGQQVAFTRWAPGELGTLYIINLDGSGERAVLGEILQAKSPTWSPDGQSIVVSFQQGGLRNPQPECRNFDNDDGVRIPDNVQITKVHVGLEGLTICFIRNEDLQWLLRRVDVASGEFEDLPVDLYSYNPTWDPQNPWRVVYDGEKGLMQLDLTNGSNWPLTADLRDTGPVFSPDGQRLALTYKQHDHWEVYTLDLSDPVGSRRRLTKPPILAEPQYSSAAPAWSPDGSQLAFVTDRSGVWEIWVMNADGGDSHPLFPSEVQAQLGMQYNGVNERLLNWLE